MFLLIKKTMIKIASVILTTALIVGTIGTAINHSKPKDSVDKHNDRTLPSSYNASKSQSNSDQISSTGFDSIERENSNNIVRIENVENDFGLQEVQNYSDTTLNKIDVVNNIVRINNLENDLENQETTLRPVDHNLVETIIKDTNLQSKTLEPLSYSSSLISKENNLSSSGFESKDQNIIQNSLSQMSEDLSDEEDSNKSAKLYCSLSDNSLHDNLSSSESLSDMQDFSKSIRLPLPSRYGDSDISSTQCMSVRITPKFDNQQQTNTEHDSSSSSIDLFKKSQVESNTELQSYALTEENTNSFSLNENTPIHSYIPFNATEALNFIETASKLKTVSITNYAIINSREPQLNPLTEDILLELYNDSTSKTLVYTVAKNCISVEQFVFSELYKWLLISYNRGCINEEQFKSLSKKLPNDLINFLNQNIFSDPFRNPGQVKGFHAIISRFIYDSIESEIKSKI